MKPIYICGSGNVAQALADGFLKCHITIHGTFSRSGNSISGIPCLAYGDPVPEGSAVFLAVPDDAIADTESWFLPYGAVTIHCSGSQALSVLKSPVTGVFYPLQTWTRGFEVSWQKVPVFIETEDPELKQWLQTLAETLGTTACEASSEQRKKLHVAAVFANNFSNAVVDMAFQLASEAGFDPQILMPLIAKTFDKFQKMDPHTAQTGPAKRGDLVIQETHLQALANHPEMAEIYTRISQWIREAHRGDARP